VFKNFELRDYMMVYLGLSLTASFFVILRDIVFTRTIMKNSSEIHNKMLNAMLNMKLKFFNLFPTTRIDFKMSYDMRRIDRVINLNISRLFESLAFVFGGMLILNYVYIGTMLLVTILLCIYIRSIVRRFVTTTTRIIQFIAENTSSMLNVYKISINEMTRYRVLGKIDIIRKEFESTANEMQRAKSHLGLSKRWLGMRILVINATLIFVAYLIPNIIVFYL
jgi:ABC-type multidrug transport system fused ATPase/permease subunit